MFGTDNELWKKMLASMKDDHLTIAGVDFSKTELEVLGNFYRYIRGENIILHCIDERCVDDLDNAGSQVHEHCGACAAVGSAINTVLNEVVDVEDLLQAELNPGAPKQPIHPEMQNHHTSMVILIDLSGADIVNHTSREELRAANALPFNVSLPLEIIQTYIDQLVASDAESSTIVEILVLALTKWNVQIASNIIGGSHNQLKDVASQTILVIDRRGISSRSDKLREEFIKASEVVPHAEVLRIEDAYPAS